MKTITMVSIYMKPQLEMNYVISKTNLIFFIKFKFFTR